MSGHIFSEFGGAREASEPQKPCFSLSKTMVFEGSPFRSRDPPRLPKSSILAPKRLPNQPQTALKNTPKMLSILVPKNTPKMAPKWEPKWSQNGPLALPKSTVGDCKVIPGRRGHPNGAVGSPRARFGHPRGPFWVRFRARKRTQPCTDTLLKPTTSPTLSSVFHLVFFLIVR